MGPDASGQLRVYGRAGGLEVEGGSGTVTTLSALGMRSCEPSRLGVGWGGGVLGGGGMTEVVGASHPEVAA